MLLRLLVHVSTSILEVEPCPRVGSFDNLVQGVFRGHSEGVIWRDGSVGVESLLGLYTFIKQILIIFSTRPDMSRTCIVY